MKKLLFLLFILFTIKNTYSQDLHEAPTMQIGLSGLSLTKGNLDADLIAEIIAEKQKEVKTRLIKNMLLKTIGVDNGLFYTYIDNSIEIITTEKDEDTRVKNLLENTVNLAFVVGYAEYYVRTLKKGTPERDLFRVFANSYGIESSLFESEQLSLKDFAKIKYENSNSTSRINLGGNRSIIKKQNKFLGVLIDLFAEQIRTNEQLKSLGILRTNYLQNYSSLNAYLNLEGQFYTNEISTELNNIFDLFTEKENKGYEEDIKEIGNSLKNKQQYTIKTDIQKLKKYTNDLTLKVNTIKNNLSKETSLDKVYKEFIEDIKSYQSFYGNEINNLYKKKYGIHYTSSLKDANLKDQMTIFAKYENARLEFDLLNFALNKKNLADAVYKNVQANLNKYLNYFGIIKTLSSKSTNFEQGIDAIFEVVGEDYQVKYKSLLKAYKTARGKIKDIKDLNDLELSDLESISGFLSEMEYFKLNQSEFIKRFEKDIAPSLIRLSKHAIEFIDLKDDLRGNIYVITQKAAQILKELNVDLESSTFLKIFSKIDEFDKAATYADFLNLLSDVGDVFSDEGMRKSINLTINFIRSYIKFEKVDDETKLNLDVEGFLLSLQKIPYNRYSPLEFHFSVGANTAAFNRDFVINSTDTIRNYSFIGEKIGVKFKLWDYKYLNSFSKGDTFSYWGYKYKRNAPSREPIVSNIHILLYGSGILYNLVNTGTTRDFNAPMAGIGLGVTFFNDLDFNVSYGKPILNDRSFFGSSNPSFLNFGFDIQFLEYFNRLSEKRKASKAQKMLSEANNN